MKRFLLIIAGGLAIWGLSLVWPYVNTVLAPEAADAVIVGLVVATAAYLLGRQFTTGNDTAGTVEPAAKTHEPTRPSVRVINPFGRNPHPTIIPQQTRPGFHSRATQPVPALQGRVHHSRITRPMPVGR